MIATYVQPSTKLLQPLPPHFARNFITGGWRKIERMYGARTDQLVKWHEMAGGRDLDAARKAFMATGVVTLPAGGRETV